MAAAGVEEEGQDEYLLALESSDMANLCADVASLGFLGGEGITPGRLLRVAHALTRVTLLTIAGRTPGMHQTASLPRLVSATAALPKKSLSVSGSPCRNVRQLLVSADNVPANAWTHLSGSQRSGVQRSGLLSSLLPSQGTWSSCSKQTRCSMLCTPTSCGRRSMFRCASRHLQLWRRSPRRWWCMCGEGARTHGPWRSQMTSTWAPCCPVIDAGHSRIVKLAHARMSWQCVCLLWR